MKSITLCLLVTSCVVLYASMASCQLPAAGGNPFGDIMAQGTKIIEQAQETFSKMAPPALPAGRKKRDADDEEKVEYEYEERKKRGLDTGDTEDYEYGDRKKREADETESVEEGPEGGDKKDKGKGKGKGKGKCGKGKNNKDDKDSSESSESSSDKLKDMFKKAADPIAKAFGGRKKRGIPSFPSFSTDNEEAADDTTAEPESSEEESSEESTEARKKRLVHYNIRDLIEEKYTIV